MTDEETGTLCLPELAHKPQVSQSLEVEASGLQVSQGSQGGPCVGSTGSEPERKKGVQLKWAVERALAADWYIYRGIRPTLQKRAEAGLQTGSPSSLTSIYFTGGRRFLTPAGLGST